MADHRLYVQIYDDMRGKILAGEYKPGDHLPAIGELIRDKGISRQTAGKAFRQLAKEGLAERVPGLGWYVPDPLAQQLS
jgi:DNA-binding GntR family transcriptional regulator